jgi:hypothetical protein
VSGSLRRGMASAARVVLEAGNSAALMLWTSPSLGGEF